MACDVMSFKTPIFFSNSLHSSLEHTLTFIFFDFSNELRMVNSNDLISSEIILRKISSFSTLELVLMLFELVADGLKRTNMLISWQRRKCSNDRKLTWRQQLLLLNSVLAACSSDQRLKMVLSFQLYVVEGPGRR